MLILPKQDVFFDHEHSLDMQQFTLHLAGELMTLATRHSLRTQCATDIVKSLRSTLRRDPAVSWALEFWGELATAVGRSLYFYQPERTAFYDLTYASFQNAAVSLGGFIATGQVIHRDGMFIPIQDKEPTIEEPLFTAFEVATLGQALTQHLGALTPVDTPEWRVSEADWQRFWRVQQRFMVLIAKVVANGPKE